MRLLPLIRYVETPGGNAMQSDRVPTGELLVCFRRVSYLAQALRCWAAGPIDSLGVLAVTTEHSRCR